METKEKQRLIVQGNYKFTEFGGQPVEKIYKYWVQSIFRWSEGKSGSWQIFLVCSLNVSGILLRDHRTTDTTTGLTWAVLVVSLKFIFSCPALPCMALRKGQLYFHSDSRWEEWEETGNVSLESSSQVLEETRRIQDPVHFVLIFIKNNHGKTSLFAN